VGIAHGLEGHLFQNGSTSCPRCTEEIDEFDGVYTAIVNKILEEVRRNPPVVYAVPGDPTIGEATVSALLRLAAEEKLSVRVLHGISFIEPCLGLLGLDALDGLSIFDARRCGC